MNLIELWRSHLAEKRAKQISDEIARENYFARLRSKGICEFCHGHGKSDNPPWEITTCSECGGTGKRSGA